MRVRAWRVIFIVASVFSISLVAQVPARGQVWPNGYSYARTITISHAEVANTDQTNFPVLLSGTYSYLATTSNGGGVTNSNGYDIIFTSDANGLNILPFERESYNSSTGAVNFWVQVPTVSHTTDTVIYLFYGNSSVTTDQSNKNGTWDSNFKAVIHFPSATSLQSQDSTSLGNNLTNSGATAGSGNIGGAAVTAANSAYLDLSNPVGFPTGTSQRTLETWFKKTDGSTSNEEILGYGANTSNGDRFSVFFGSSSLGVEAQNDGRAFSWSNDGNWHHVALVLPSGGSRTSDVVVYLDGVLQSASGGSLTLNTSGADFAVGTVPGFRGNYGFNGSVDEVRVSNTARSADWIATEYNNQSSPSTFYTIGSGTSYSGPNISSLSPSSGNIGDSVTITGTSFGSSQGTSTVTFAGTSAMATSWSSTQIIATVPTGAISGNVIVTVGSQPSNAAHFTITGGSWSNGYGYRRAVTIYHTQVPNTDQTNFPMLFSGKYPYLASTSDGGYVTNSNGYDVVFTLDAAGTTVLPFEQESYDPATGTVNYWVQVPSVSHTYDTVIFLFYGNSSVTTDQSNKNGVWDSNFQEVLHLSETSGTTVFDSTVNGNNGTKHSSTSPAPASGGKIGGDQSFNGTSDYVALPAAMTTTLSRFSVSFWTKTTDSGSNGTYWNRPQFVGDSTSGNNSGDFGINTNSGDLGMWSGLNSGGDNSFLTSSAINDNNWHFIEGVNTGSVIRLYLDGADTGQTLSSGLATDTFGWYLGAQHYYAGGAAYYHQGSIDEFRVSTTARSADWIATEYHNQSFPIGFYDEGTIAITNLSPSSGYYATSVTISGRHFGSSQGASTVTFNGIAATPTSWSDTSIVVPVPFGASSGNVVVTASSIASNGMSFSIFPAGWSDQDISSPGVAGSASYLPDTFTVNGAGNISGTADAFNFAYQSLSGDGTIVARILSLSGGATTQSAGVMIRETLTAGSKYYYVNYYPSNSGFGWGARTTTNGSTSGQTTTSGLTPPHWLKIVRSGTTFTGYLSADGVDWTQTGSSQTISMATSVYIGLAVDSANTSNFATATFDNVSVTQSSSPAPVISSVSQTTGSVGGQVVILGSNFGSTQSDGGVMLNAVPVTINSWSATVIDVTIPSGASTGYLVVSVAPSMDSNPVFFTVTSQALPSGWFDADIGIVGTTGSAGYASGTFTVSGAGSGLGGTADAFHFVYQPLSAAGTIVARVTGFSAPYSTGSAGVMIRETLTAGSTETSSNFENSGASAYYGYLNYRTSTNGTGTGQQGSTPQAFVPYWVKITRSGNTLSGYVSTDGVTWTQIVSTQTISMATDVYIGLAVTSGSTSTLATATFDHVSTYSGGEVSGTISKASDGTALSGALIQAIQLGSVIGTATSDSSGNYGMYLSGGSYDMQVSASGYGTTVTNAVLVPVDAVTTFNASLSSPGSVSGTITQSNGVTAIQGAVVQALVGDAAVASATSASDGSYTISGLNAGTYQIQAMATGYVSAGQSSSVTAGGNATANISLQTQSSGAVSYVYDPLGRLVGVINPSGNTAIYNYDAVGNVLSISTQSSANLSLISFAPATGTFGTTVTIYGTGFNTTPSQNTVKFNGLVGTVTSATPTQLIVTAPIGATTGTISVTTSAGTATSVSSFTVNP